VVRWCQQASHTIATRLEAVASTVMAAGWAKKYSVSHDVEGGDIELRWTDDDGDHTAPVRAPDSSRKACGERFVTKDRRELICARIVGREGSHVPLDELSRSGAVAD
jgi:hypothetical protein